MPGSGSPGRADSTRPPPAVQLEGAALLFVPLALLLLSHRVPWGLFNLCLAGAYLPEALARPHRAVGLLVLLAATLALVRALRA